MALYSGLETDGMKKLGCTLKFQPQWNYAPEVMSLRPQTFKVSQDGRPPVNIPFRGCKVIQLGAQNTGGGLMPIILTIGGPCHYTKGDKKDYEIMMRTKEQSLAMHLPTNGEMDWPDYRAMETCPMCCHRAKPGTEDRYWMLFQPLMQAASNGVGIRPICRLTCEDCFDSLVGEKYIHAITGSTADAERIPLLDAIEEQGPMTWISDVGQRLPSHVDKVCMRAYDLFQCWEATGAWQALTNVYGELFQQAAASKGQRWDIRTKSASDPITYWEMDQIPVKDGRKCDCGPCQNVHGKRKPPEPGQKKGKRIRLMECTGCFETMYCSERCQTKAWPEHKQACREVQRKRNEEEEAKKAKAKLDEAARMEAALASFVPLSVTPQGGGSKKKKGKKGKKKGKK